jgi:hypothetical protein
MSTQTDPPRSTTANESDGATASAQAKAQEVVGRAQDQAQAVAGQTQDRVREQVDQRSTQLGEQIDQHASDLRSVGEALRDQGNDRPAQATDRLADYAERAGSYLQAKDADSLLSDAEEFGRQKPAAVAAGALALGFVAARFLKASSSRRYAAGGVPQSSRSSSALPAASPVGQQAEGIDPAGGAPAGTGM